MRIKLMAIVWGALFSVPLVAEPGTYKGVGTFRDWAGHSGNFSGTLIFKEIVPPKIYQWEETWGPSVVPRGSHSLTLRFANDGTILVKRDSVPVGSGYSFNDPEGLRMDFKFQGGEGPEHVNCYYDKVKNQVFILADGVLNGHSYFWTNRLSE